MDNYNAIISTMLAQALRKEGRLSDRQVALLEWNQIEGSHIRLRSGRVIHLTPSTSNALRALPVRGRYIFSTSALPPVGAPTPTAHDRAQERIQKLQRAMRARRHLRIEFR